MVPFDKLEIPQEGKEIEITEGRLSIPDNPIIPFIEGDGIGPEVMKVAREVLDATINRAYKGEKKIVWLEICAGEKAKEKYGKFLPQDTLEAIKYFVVAIKGPLGTPIGGGYRSLNVTLRQALDLYACVRPVRYVSGAPSPVVHPEKMDMVIFRENTEDIYAGIEWSEGSSEAKKLISYLNQEFGVTIRQDSGLGVKPISITGSKRLVRKALQYAVDNGRKSITLVHKGNIMKFTEGSFRDWGYEVANEEFGDRTIPEKELLEEYGGEAPEGKIVIKDRITDNMLQQVLTRTEDYDVIATPNLNGDYLSDACAAQIGGLGLAPGANIGDYMALFEPTHGSSPKYAGMDKANPGSMILTGMMMLQYLGWEEAEDLIWQAMVRTIKERKVTHDLARLMEGVEPVKCSEFGKAVIENLD
jgi:isocitrate dehydrogenase